MFFLLVLTVRLQLSRLSIGLAGINSRCACVCCCALHLGSQGVQFTPVAMRKCSSSSFAITGATPGEDSFNDSTRHSRSRACHLLELARELRPVAIHPIPPSEPQIIRIRMSLPRSPQKSVSASTVAARRCLPTRISMLYIARSADDHDSSCNECLRDNRSWLSSRLALPPAPMSALTRSHPPRLVAKS